jgi:hypothetical protein
MSLAVLSVTEKNGNGLEPNIRAMVKLIMTLGFNSGIKRR